MPPDPSFRPMNTRNSYAHDFYEGLLGYHLPETNSHRGAPPICFPEPSLLVIWAKDASRFTDRAIDNASNFFSNKSHLLNQELLSRYWAFARTDSDRMLISTARGMGLQSVPPDYQGR